MVFFARVNPPTPTRRPIVLMLHGGLHTSDCFLSTANGDPGWAQLFASRGYPVIAPDWPGHGRSELIAEEVLTGELVCRAVADLVNELGSPIVLLTHSMAGAYGWRILELCDANVLAVAAIAPGPPGNIQAQPELIREGDAEIVVRNGERTTVLPRHGFVTLPQSYMAEKLIGRSTRFPRQHMDAYLSSRTNTSARLLYERINVHGSQIRVEDVACLSNKPVLVVTGTEDIDHPRQSDVALVEWLRQQGAEATHMWLGDCGIEGNGHMLMMESNSDEVGALVLDWLEQELFVHDGRSDRGYE